MGLDRLMDRYQQFIEDRDWSKFHTPKSVSMAIAIEAAELMELFQWHDNLPASKVASETKLMAQVKYHRQ